MGVWHRAGAAARTSHAVAIYNYSPLEYASPPGSISIHIGELVEILAENEDWYFGRRVCRNPEEKGIFPKSFVKVRDCAVNRTGSVEVVSIVQPEIVQEITYTLREWGRHWKELYVKHAEQFKFIENRMRTLLELRGLILSAKLPIDQLKSVQLKAIYTIDIGNRELNMDLTVRCQKTNRQINPTNVSTCQLYNLHVDTAENIKKRKQDKSPLSPQSPSHTHNSSSYGFYASVKNFVCKMNEDAELLMSLYDGVTHKHFTENYVVRWSRDGLASDIDQLHNLKILFTDLGSSDIKREKVLLVCYVIRIGGMEAQQCDNRRSSVVAAIGRSLSQTGGMMNGDLNGKSSQNMRRPLGIAVMDITHILSGQLELDDDKQYCLPFFPCEKDNLESLLKRIIMSKELKGFTKTEQGLWISVKLLQGDLKQIREEEPHLIVGNVCVARKMGFPEVILPSDVRNDLYLNVLHGNFTRGGNKASNIQVTTKVCNQYGEIIPGVLYPGAGAQPRDEYNSVIYYHEDRPKWHEIFKIGIPIEEFKSAHLVFLFKHRSSNESKDKNDKPFAMSYTPLMEKNGTTLNDTTHCLHVYKVDSKKWSNDIEAATCYLTLPSRKSGTGEKENVKFHKGFLSHSPKDSFYIETTVCSTKLTQNVELLGLLNWVANDKTEQDLKQSLINLQEVPGGEVVKFLRDILDALFNILCLESLEKVDGSLYLTRESYDYLVFECLLFLISLVSDRKYHHFQPVLDLYINDSFCAPLAYQKLCRVLSQLMLEKADQERNDVLLKSMKCLEYLVRFIVKSRQLHAELTRKTDEIEFQQLFLDLSNSAIVLMQCSSNNALTSQGSLIKYLPAAVPHIVEVFPDVLLSTVIGKILDVLPLDRITKQRLMAILDFVQGPLFLNSSCRCILLPHITKNLKVIIENNQETSKYGVEIRSKNRSVDKIARVLGASKHKLQEHRGYSEELELCIKVLGEILTLLFSTETPTDEEFNHIVAMLFRTILIAASQMERENPLVCQLVSILLEMLRQMTLQRYNILIMNYSSKEELLEFLIEVQIFLRDLVEKPVFQSHWADMINLQNYVVLKTLELFSITLVDFFMSPLKEQVWSNWFHLAIAFLTQNSLQLEHLTTDQQRRLTVHYGDMRTDCAFQIKQMWLNLEQHKILFIPELVGPFLEMSLIPETELRKTTIPLFFDMMQCEYNAPKCRTEIQSDLDSGYLNENFDKFENEMIHKLDVLVEGGQGDAQWRSLFVMISESQWDDNCVLKSKGENFVSIVARLMDTILQYRESHDHSNMDHRMQAITTLLDFYSKIKRPEMYIRYVNKLCELHLDCENWTEAGLTLRLHATLLHWSNMKLNTLYKSHRHPDCQTHRDLKVALYYDIIEYLDKGKMWELAVGICKELVKQYEDEILDYISLSQLYKNMADFYEHIMKQLRPQPEYFRVGYYGKGFPEFLQNKVFVYRGKEYERLTDFCTRTMNGLPNAELMVKLTPPGQDILNSTNQYVQINAVEPVISGEFRMNKKHLSGQILSYYKSNEIKNFRFSRPFHRQDEALMNYGEESSQNEFATLWLARTELEISDKFPGILRWFPVSDSKTYDMSPLHVAIDTMEEANKALKELIIEHKGNCNLPLDPLTRKLNGVVDAAVMGGVANYEKAFFTEKYQNAHPEHRTLIHNLKDLIAEQIPILEIGIEVHRSKLPQSLSPLHKRISECFDKMRTHVYEKYGKKTYDLDKEISAVTMRRHVLSNSNFTHSTVDNRWSEISNPSNESGLYSKYNTSTFKSTFTNHFNKQLHRASFNTGIVNPGFGHSTPGRSVSILPSPVKKKEKDKKKSRKNSEICLPTAETPTSTGSSQWYTGSTPSLDISSNGKTHSISSDILNSSAIFELNQELVPTRPLRSEAEKEKRFSQRQSIQSGTNSNRNSAGTTDSNISTDDDPPPLPQKSTKSDIPPPLFPRDDGLYQAVNYPTIASQAPPRSAVTSPVMRRQDYDTVIKARGSFLYKSLQPQDKKNISIRKDKIPPVPPPKTRTNQVQH